VGLCLRGRNDWEEAPILIKETEVEKIIIIENFHVGIGPPHPTSLLHVQSGVGVSGSFENLFNISSASPPTVTFNNYDGQSVDFFKLMEYLYTKYPDLKEYLEN
jgi:hypothetical protein